MKIIVCGVDEIEDILDTHPILSVLSIEQDIPEFRAPRLNPPFNQEILSFWDIETIAQNGVTDLPSHDHVNQSFAFLEGAKNRGKEMAAIHCTQGQSRSTAIALSWRVREEGLESLAPAIDQILETRTDPGPNLAIIEIADMILGLENQFLDTIKNHQGFSENRMKLNLLRKEQSQALCPQHTDLIITDDPPESGTIPVLNLL